MLCPSVSFMCAPVCPVCPQVMREAGVPTPSHQFVHVRLNGKFFGLYSIVEELDKTFLKVRTL